MDAQNGGNRGEFTWKICNFTEQKASRVCSEVFMVSGCKWRILVFPKGNGTNHLSLYVDVPDSATLPKGWSRNAEFSLSVIDQIDNVRSIRYGFTLVDCASTKTPLSANVMMAGGSDDEDMGSPTSEPRARGFNQRQPHNPASSKLTFTLDDLPYHRWPERLQELSEQSKGRQYVFTSSQSDWGYKNFIPLTKLHDPTWGYLANDTLVVKAEVCVLKVAPPVNQLARPTDNFDSYFTGLEKLINAAETNSISAGSSLCHQDGALKAEIPSLEEVAKAKQSLKECLSDLFKLNMKEKLSEALSTLSSASAELSLEQKLAIETFQANFNGFTSNFFTFEQDNAEFELHKLQRDERFSAMKKSHETHILYKQLMDDLAREDKELKRKMEEVKSRRDKLLSDWEILLVESEEAKWGYKDEQKKVAEAEEKKRLAEERMSRSITAWSNLKARFC